MAKRLTIEVEFEHGDEVYVVTDPGQFKRIVTSINIKPKGAIVYELSMDGGATYHYDFELSGEKSDLTRIENY